MFGFSSFSEAPFSSQAGNSYRLNCDAGSYLLTGGAATFSYVRRAFANAGSYTVTGYSAGFTHDKVLQGNAGSYSLTGADAGLDYDQVLVGEGGSYAISGNSASFATGKSLIAGAFSFQLTGNSAGLLKSTVVQGEPGSYNLTGNDADFAKGKSIIAGAGAYLFTGQQAELTYTPIPVVVVESKGGIGKKEKKKREAEKASREELEAIVKREFDILDGTYQPEVVEVAKQAVLPQIKEIDYSQYQIAIAQVNALLLQAKIRAAEYEAELDDEEALLMLL